MKTIVAANNACLLSTKTLITIPNHCSPSIASRSIIFHSTRGRLRTLESSFLSRSESSSFSTEDLISSRKQAKTWGMNHSTGLASAINHDSSSSRGEKNLFQRDWTLLRRSAHFYSRVFAKMEISFQSFLLRRDEARRRTREMGHANKRRRLNLHYIGRSVVRCLSCKLAEFVIATSVLMSDELEGGVLKYRLIKI